MFYVWQKNAVLINFLATTVQLCLVFPSYIHIEIYLPFSTARYTNLHLYVFMCLCESSE